MSMEINSYPSVLHMLQDAVETAPDQLAIVCGQDTLTYRDYLNCITQVSQELRHWGVTPGDRVMTLLGNSADAAVATFAVQASGAQLVPLNPAYTQAELVPVFADAEPKVILHDAKLKEHIGPVAPKNVRCVSIGPGARRLIVAQSSTPAALNLPQPDTLSTLQYTGGTTGTPKGVNLTHGAISVNVAQREALLPTQDGEQVMCITPLFHVYAVSMGLYLAANCRGTLHIVQKFDAGTVLQDIQRHLISFLSASPTIFLGLMRHEGFGAANLRSLRVCSSGSAALPEQVLRRWEAVTGCPVCEGYGQTEAGPVLTYNPLNGLRKPGTVGHTVPMTEVQIVDPETGTRLMPAGDEGEIRARGPQVMAGYRNRQKETSEVLRDGWLYTGDIGRLDSDGYLTICDRKKDMVVTAGFNVYPREIEEVLFAHPLIADAAVIGVPDDYRGEALIALVVRTDPSLTADAVMEHLSPRLTKYKWPRDVRFFEALPKTPVAKTDKAALRRMWQDQSIHAPTEKDRINTANMQSGRSA
ncbi:MAG: AMP-binding protein [Pararhodobacter sp.]|nr:AMP-binding protein [Pararhodobacter sp.]